MNMDKIPLKDAKEVDNEMMLYGIKISEAEYANSQKINDLIDWCRELQEKITRLENR